MTDESTAPPPKRGLTWLFLNDRHQPRALWRIVFFVGLLVVLSIAVSALAAAARLQERIPDGLAGQYVGRTVALVVTAVATALAARATEGRTLADVGFGLGRGWWREAVFGFAFGAAVLLVAVLPSAAAGWVEGGFNVLSAGMLVWLGFWVIAGAWEELLLRGFVFQAIGSGVGWVPAAVITSALFALLHFGNPNFGEDTVALALAAANTFAAGVLFAVAYLRTRTLWLATGAHVGWNFASGTLLGLPVSGITEFGPDRFHDASLLRSAETGPDLATGGAYGPEAALVTLAVFAAACLVLARIPVPKTQRAHSEG